MFAYSGAAVSEKWKPLCSTVNMLLEMCREYVKPIFFKVYFDKQLTGGVYANLMPLDECLP